MLEISEKEYDELVKYKKAYEQYIAKQKSEVLNSINSNKGAIEQNNQTEFLYKKLNLKNY